ncbi:chymotrypsin-like [Wyeomyia smithii]|uniref:chymotrypsin-like n=1 Tax=Wyeomyia smithii TaxID=174621 RepID=UPI002467B3B0|nr:chymotrypsin-like [Wyeomyia smithii]
MWGSVLTRTYVLTAARCVTGASEGVAVFGAHHFNAEDSAMQIANFSASGVIVHLEYNPDNLLNDMATIRLNNAITYTKRVRSIRLPAPGDQRSFAGLDGTIAGFGATENQDPSELLRYMSESILTSATCVEQWENSYISEQHICLSGNNSRSVCNNDIGGPLTITENGEALQVGIAFFAGPNCTGRPSVYARFTHFLPWIKANSDYGSGGIRSAVLNSMFFLLFSCFVVSLK